MKPIPPRRDADTDNKTHPQISQNEGVRGLMQIERLRTAWSQSVNASIHSCFSLIESGPAPQEDVGTA